MASSNDNIKSGMLTIDGSTVHYLHTIWIVCLESFILQPGFSTFIWFCKLFFFCLQCLKVNYWMQFSEIFYSFNAHFSSIDDIDSSYCPKTHFWLMNTPPMRYTTSPTRTLILYLTFLGHFIELFSKNLVNINLL